MEDKVKKFRSPQFPFIPLEKAVNRAREFEAQYHHHQARAANAVKAWGYGQKSSGGIQTIAALCAFGLMEDEGSLEDRKLKLTPLAMTILKDARAGAAKEALKTAALTPKSISEQWKEWGVVRPANAECISTLELDKGYSEEAAKRFLAVYDATILYAVLDDPDKMVRNALDEEEENQGQEEYREERQRNPLPQSSLPRSQVQLMTGERVVFAHELKPDQGFRVVVNGPVDTAMLDAIEAYAKFQKALLKSVVSDKKPDEQAH